MTDHQIAAMDALFAFSEAMTAGGLSIADLAAVMHKAIADGSDLLVIQLSMAILALEQKDHPPVVARGVVKRGESE